MLKDTLKEICELGYEVMWTYDEVLNEIRIRVKKGQKAYMTAIQRGGDSRATEFTLDVAIRTLVEKLEKGENHE